MTLFSPFFLFHRYVVFLFSFLFKAFYSHSLVHICHNVTQIHTIGTRLKASTADKQGFHFAEKQNKRSEENHIKKHSPTTVK
jgi:hypothetical protein